MHGYKASTASTVRKKINSVLYIEKKDDNKRQKKYAVSMDKYKSIKKASRKSSVGKKKERKCALGAVCREQLGMFLLT